MRIDEVLTERKSAELYHGTHDAEKILRSGGLEPQLNNPEYPDDPDAESGKPYISLTRDFRLAGIHGFPVVFVINQEKLTTSHKIRPIDAQMHSDQRDQYVRRLESEERVYKKIPLSYISRIIITDEEWVDDIDEVKELAEKNNIPVVYKNIKGVR